jgi:nicotinate-nucleotide adenylyltransferase
VIKGEPRRIGLLGGSFDPPHLGHLQLARDAIAALTLDELRFVVAGDPWQKGRITPAHHRLAMVELAVKAEPGCSVERCELERAGPTYTFDTLRTLRERLGPEICLVWIMGSDQYANLHTWHRHAELTNLANIAVALRAGSAETSLPAPDAGTLGTPYGQRVHFAMTPHPASSTLIRQNPEKQADLLAPPVLAYIRAHSLYVETTHAALIKKTE